MMSALIKELLHDYSHNKLDIDTRISIISAIEQLHRSGTFTKQDILLLEYYLRGFSSEEIAVQFFLSTQTVETILSRLLIAIEYLSGHLDELMLRKWSTKYNPRQINYAKECMIKYSKEFTYEAI